MILFNCKAKIKNVKHESGSADLVAPRKTLRNTRRIVIGSDINVKINGKVKGSGRGRPLYTNSTFTSPGAPR